MKENWEIMYEKVNEINGTIKIFDSEEFKKLKGWEGEWKLGETTELDIPDLLTEHDKGWISTVNNYDERIDFLLVNNKIEWPFPNIHLSLEDFIILANRMISYFSWMSPVKINMIKPKEHHIFNRYYHSVDNIVLAAISYEVDPSDNKIYGISDIYICRKEFLTVGVLLHELAHMYDPTDYSHGEIFQFALSEIIKVYWSMRQFN